MNNVILFVACVVIVVVAASLLAYPFMWMWNYAVLQALTIAKPLTYWPAFWLMIFNASFVVSSNAKRK